MHRVFRDLEASLLERAECGWELPYLNVSVMVGVEFVGPPRWEDLRAFVGLAESAAGGEGRLGAAAPGAAVEDMEEAEIGRAHV